MSFLVQRSDVGEFRRRYSWLVLVVLVAFTGLVAKLVQLQIVEADLHRAQARRNITGEIRLATTRGVIRDANGKVLAANRPSYNVYVVPEAMDLKTTWPLAAQLMGLGPDEKKALEDKIAGIQATPSARRSQQILLKVDVDRNVVAALKTHEDDLPGVQVVPVPVRFYPYGALGAHSIGYMREIDPDTLAKEEDQGYRAGDRIGAVGIERRWESYLRGERGLKRFVHWQRAHGNREEMENRYLEEPRTVEPIPGRDISLTIDIDLVGIIEKAFRGQLAGSVVVIDVRTGRILAALSKPGFDANVVSGGNGTDAVREEFQKLYSDPLKPTLDKTISAAYPPGSTYKPFTALAALADHLITPNTRVDCHGGYTFGRRFFRCTGVHRSVDLYQAIVQSCNTYFYSIGEQIHIDRLAEIGTEFGFGVKTGVGVNPEARGRMPTKAWYTRRMKGGFRGGFTLLAAIGQGATTVSVTQLALAYAALANGGTLYQPQIVRSIETSDGTIVQEFPPRVRRVIDIDPERLNLIHQALRGVVYEKKGTANREKLPEVDMAGKTGTAQVTHVTPKGVDPDKNWYYNRDHAWFAGYAPSESPEIAIVVMVEHGGGGGLNAVPIAMKVVRDWQKLKAERMEARSASTTKVAAPSRHAP
ncbi:MAG TPA: penicillin-binding protein 2 [Polyangiaceae bacterium]|nr:penicillin-binding protein 2 [Polyangiaceae bacterium]